VLSWRAGVPHANVGDIELYYELAGPRDAPVIMLIHGLATPMVAWPELLVDRLVDRGFRVLLFDNRDAGKSSRITPTRKPNLISQMVRAYFGRSVLAPYSLSDMACDVVQLLDHLSLDRVHVVGASMGGMIAQHLASEHRNRILSLVSLMSSSGNPSLPGPAWRVRMALFSEPGVNSSKQEKLDFDIGFWRATGSPAYQPSDADLRVFVEKLHTWNEGASGGGGERHLLAILKSGNRIPLLRQIVAPTLVLHGEEDPFVRPEAGRDTAKNIPGAKLLMVPGMGHDIPFPLIPFLADTIADHAMGAMSEVGIASGIEKSKKVNTV